MRHGHFHAILKATPASHGHHVHHTPVTVASPVAKKPAKVRKRKSRSRPARVQMRLKMKAETGDKQATPPVSPS
jgi:hypothetical protein